ncbi:MAG: oligosaccharide flippase family protein [Pseudomonadota bacterium]
MKSIADVKALIAGDGLKSRSYQATLLTFGAFGIAKLMQLGANLIVTRLLVPEAFGLMALVSVFLTGLTMMSDVGIKASVIRSEHSDDPRFQSTAWTLQVVRGCWLAGLAVMLAWPYSRIYDEPVLFPLILICAATPFFSGFWSIEASMAERRLKLGRIVVMQLLSRAVTTIVMVFFAWWLQSVWGLAIGTVTGTAISSALSHVVLKSSNHKFVWDKSVLSEIVLFGRWILLATFFGFLGNKGLQGIRGYMVELDTLAFLHIALMFGMIITDLMQKLLNKVAYPILAETVRLRPQRLRRMTSRIKLAQTLFSTPAFIGLSLIAPALIETLYDPRYLDAGPFLSLIALSNAIAVLPLVYQKVLLALGDSRTHAFISMVASGLRIAAVFIGLWYGGVLWMLIADAIVLLFVFTISITIAVRKGYANLKIDFANIAVLGLAYLLIVPPLL